MAKAAQVRNAPIQSPQHTINLRSRKAFSSKTAGAAPKGSVPSRSPGQRPSPDSQETAHAIQQKRARGEPHISPLTAPTGASKSPQHDSSQRHGMDTNAVIDHPAYVAAQEHKTHTLQTPKAATKHPIHAPEYDARAGPSVPTIRQVPRQAFAEEEASSHAESVVSAGGQGSPVFNQPALDPCESRRFVFGNMRAALPQTTEVPPETFGGVVPLPESIHENPLNTPAQGLGPGRVHENAFSAIFRQPQPAAGSPFQGSPNPALMQPPGGTARHVPSQAGSSQHSSHHSEFQVPMQHGQVFGQQASTPGGNLGQCRAQSHTSHSGRSVQWSARQEQVIGNSTAMQGQSERRNYAAIPMTIGRGSKQFQDMRCYLAQLQHDEEDEASGWGG
ncbi:hypothetical protein BU26DRAFT_564078 [Trematosphaeria pertusa]|uniref:Uncharacterized protein n=1 Tax=Trematosphaeria pertusa TaxID=390896 RepID=A0A6A6IIG3_9PLEO|nr:uncharacterized protein BU26DRAFT_564078 [Trematosphaeria pertusa]KAF2250201.1 hypothetical protein BU26DRAFT_564078 [Trematosphaeria pertusa]